VRRKGREEEEEEEEEGENEKRKETRGEESWSQAKGSSRLSGRLTWIHQVNSIEAAGTGQGRGR